MPAAFTICLLLTLPVAQTARQPVLGVSRTPRELVGSVRSRPEENDLRNFGPAHATYHRARTSVLHPPYGISQSPYTPAGGGPTSSMPNHRILAPEYGSPTSQGPEPPARRFQPDDARLCDLSFVDPQHGWAVGDHGVILHTDDGGQHWSPQVSGVTCTLNSVCFVDVRNGWAAGGMAYPYLHDSSGVVLCTQDGGLSWQREPVLLPALRKIRFFNERQGWAVGCPSAMFPAGAFTTRDAGRSWQPACSNGTLRLVTADFYDGRNAILGGSLGLTATINEGDFARNSGPGVILPGVNVMQVVPPGYGWLAGDGGWIALTGSRGNTWRPPLGRLPPATGLFDLSALAVRGPKCWIAGSPGSRVFFTPDAGRTWSAFATNTTLPLRALVFADDLHGWAVGQLGMVLASNDGGQTWRRQRAGGARAAVMAIAGSPQDLPLELLARICKDQGYLGVAEVFGRTDPGVSPRDDVPAADRLHQALLQVGACAGETAWGFPVPDRDRTLISEAVLAGWNRVQNGRGGEALLAYVVRQIRTWRPSVILIPCGHESTGLSQITRQTVAAAVKLAGDPAFLADQFGAAGCPPWNVQRVCLVSDTNDGGKIALDGDDWPLRLGRTFTDAALPARALLVDDEQAPGRLASIQLVAGGAAADGVSGHTTARPRLGDFTNRFDVMAGIAAGDGPCRRPEAESDGGVGGPLDSLAQSRQVQAIFAQLDRDPKAVVARLTKGDELPQGIDASAAAALTFRVAERLRHSGHWDLADRTLALLVEHYPDDPLARPALVWRLQGLSSVKVDWAEPTRFSPTTSAKPSSPTNEAGGRIAEGKSPPDRKSRVPSRPSSWPARSRSITRTCLPRRLCVTRWRPSIGNGARPADPAALCLRSPRRRSRCLVGLCPRRNVALGSQRPVPKPLVVLLAATERPHLDGRLDEALWKKCPPIVLSSPLGDDHAWPATVMLAHDEQYLYLAIRCRQAPGARYEATQPAAAARSGSFAARPRRHLPRSRS